MNIDLTERPKGAHLVWAIALGTYLLAVFHRSSLAVAGLAATERFGISAAQLSSFVMLQLLVYAGMQVPVGLLVDRYGPRAVMLTGAVVLFIAQSAFALVDTYALALGARFLVGFGDAMTFVCLLRIINSWYPPRLIPHMTLISGPIGQVGAIGAAIPMTWALGRLGWTGAYLAAGAVSIVAAICVAVFVKDEPTRRTVRGPVFSWTGIRRGLAESWAEPGTRLGFWMHFCTPFSATVLGMLWGFPYFVQAHHTSEVFAGMLLTIMVVAVMFAGPVLGSLISRHPWHRSTTVLVIVWALVAVWTVVLFWPGDAPGWLLILLVIVAGVGGPASMIGFDVARTANPIERFGSANGIVNQAGFVASLVLVISIGLVLDWRGSLGDGLYTPQAFREAMSLQYVLWALGLFQIWRYRRLSRAAYGPLIDR